MGVTAVMGPRMGNAVAACEGWLRRGIAVLMAAGLPAVAAEDAAVRLDAVRDNSIVLHPAELRDNAGEAQRIRIKGNQHLVALGFDLAPLRGRGIREATLICARGDGEISGVTISTIQAEWDERRSNALTGGTDAVDGWGVPGARFPSVCGGNGFSLVCHAASDVREGAYHWRVGPDLIHALAVGAAFGLAVHEDDADYSRNPTILSRESRGRGPRLVVVPGGEDPAPEPPSGLRVADRGDPDSMRLHLIAPARGFAYEVRAGRNLVPRWNVPFVRPGEEQVIPIRDVPLAPGEEIRIEVTTLSRTCDRSSPSVVLARVPAPCSPALPAVAPPVAGGPAVEGVMILPIEDRLDAAGSRIGGWPEAWGTANEATGPGGSVLVSAARGEVAGFQIVLEGSGEVNVACEIPGARVDLFRGIFVDGPGGRIPDPLAPSGAIGLTPGAPVCVVADVYVPFDTTARELRGVLSVSDGRRVPVVVRVRDFALPREAGFLCEMNTYAMPDDVATFYDLQRVAYDHRVHCNILHYGHHSAAPGARKCSLDMRLPGGRRMDERRYNDIAPGAKNAWWDDFIAAFGPYLSGECFRDGHRGPVPAPGFYLTFHESWPLHVRAFFNGNPDAFEAFKEQPAYAETFRNILRDFLAVAAREGWHRTGFQVYLNNKGSLGDARKSPWVLDEPAAWWDYRALAFFGGLVRGAKEGAPQVRCDFRIDISRPEFDRGALRGASDLWVVSGRAFEQYGRLVRDRAEATGERIWVYGSPSPAEHSSRAIMAWVLAAYRDGAGGVVPWQTVNRDGSALRKADPLGLFILDGGGGGVPAVRSTMRLKAFRRAQQDVEYLELARRKMRWTPAQLRAFIDHYLPLAGSVQQGGEEDAGTARFENLRTEDFRALREAAAAVVQGPPPAVQAAPGG